MTNGVSGKPVFFDPAHKRWPRLRAGVTLLGLTLSLLLVMLVLSILASPVLPSLHLPSVSFLPQGAHALPAVPTLSPERPLTRRERTLRSEQIRLERARAASLQQWLVQPHKPGLLPNRQTLAIGFFVNWDDASMSSLKQNLDSLDTVIAEWLHLADEDGSLRENDPTRTAQVAAYIRSRRPEASIVPLVNNWNGHEWEGVKLARMLAKPAARARTIAQLTAYVESHHFDGISIDFENIPPRAQPDFQRFMAELYAAMHPRNLSVSVNVPANDAAFDYRRLVPHADHLILMAYDEHWNDSGPGPISSLPWFASVLRQRQRDIPLDKMIVAIGNYAYDWQKGRPTEERTFEEAVLVAKESEGRIRLDPVSLNPTFEYADD
ncbi:MAG: glycosyl hydrolase family 18 protein, partial [Candidatus Accumulibacter phosphatis]